MSNAVYPSLPGLMWPRKRTPIWKTKVATTPSGREFRSSAMTAPRYRYALQYEFLRSAAALAEYQALFAFFNARGGALDTFLLHDPDDYQVSGQAFGVGDGVTTSFQLVRSVGGFTQAVFDIDATADQPQISVAGVLASGGSYTLSATGLVTFAAPPAAGAALTWSGRFYWRARFEVDELTFEQFVAEFWKTGEVKLITVKP